MKPSGPGLLFAGRFLITVSISVLVMGLLRFSISPGSVLESCAFLRICPFLPGCPFYWHIVADSQIWLSDFTFTFYFHALEKEMATHSSVLAWRIPGTGEPDGLPSMGSHRVGHD